jgi:hypothetical protein
VFGNVITVLLFAMLIKPTVGGSMQTRTAAIVYAVLLFAFFAMFVGAAILYGIGIFISYAALTMFTGFSAGGLVATALLDGVIAYGFYTWADNNDNPLMFGIGFVVASAAMIAGGYGIAMLRERLFAA